MDQVWQKRKRLIDTRLLVVFILKLVLSRNRQGDGISLNAMWETCLDKGITPPQTDAVAASFLCEARQKLPESVFKTLNDELIGLWHAHRQDMPNWKGHRVFAVDGSKLNMPRGLLTYGYKSPRDTNRYYPCRLMSRLYNLQEQLVYDFELVSHNDERRCVPEHLAKLERGDLVIFDRGYFSYLMLHQILASGQHAVFRLQHGTINPLISEFFASDQEDAIITYVPSSAVKHGLKKRGHTQDFQPLTVRLVKCKIKDEIDMYATTLLDQTLYPIDCFRNLYHWRWSIEELYKISKQFIDVEDFHSQTERGVKHELYGHFLLINLARLFETNARSGLPDRDQQVQLGYTYQQPDTGRMYKSNFKHCLAVIGPHLEELIFVPGQILAGWLHKALVAVARLRQRSRAGRSYQRHSFKPRTRWNSFDAASGP